ncbi:Rossmann-fold NAD(P)-binding domain-containing protein [Edaphobacter bradus]|uniref:epimerase n=1 Tax=Edaphobacter bradus TaxID=2259016 RepID=UPI0021DFBC1A|nr:epimerase [Edaphobacter bradus]
MKVILFGATGMVGQGVLRECLLDDGVSEVLAVGRSCAGISDGKVNEILQQDLHDLAPIEEQLRGYDVCLFCLGASSAGMSEAEYRRVTYDLTLAIAETLVRLNPAMTFLYISGAGTNAKSRQMWARVKGETENALLGLGFRAAYMLRPGYIQPLHGIESKTKLYQRFYDVLSPMYPLLVKVARRYVISTEELGKAMLRIARNGAPKQVLEAADLVRISGGS